MASLPTTRIAAVEAFVIVGDKDYVGGAGLRPPADAASRTGARPGRRSATATSAPIRPRPSRAWSRSPPRTAPSAGARGTRRSGRAPPPPWCRTSWRRCCSAKTRWPSRCTGSGCTAACACAATSPATSSRRSPGSTSRSGIWPASCSGCRSIACWAGRSRPSCRATPRACPGVTIEERAASAERFIADGYTAMKASIGRGDLDEDLAAVGGARRGGRRPGRRAGGRARRLRQPHRARTSAASFSAWACTGWKTRCRPRTSRGTWRCRRRWRCRSRPARRSAPAGNSRSGCRARRST